MEGIVAGETTGRVGDPDRGDGIVVALQERFPSTHLGKTWWKRRRKRMRKRRRTRKSESLEIDLIDSGWKSSQVDFISKLN